LLAIAARGFLGTKGGCTTFGVSFLGIGFAAHVSYVITSEGTLSADYARTEARNED
jgi:hypothetical protein